MDETVQLLSVVSLTEDPELQVPLPLSTITSTFSNCSLEIFFIVIVYTIWSSASFTSTGVLTEIVASSVSPFAVFNVPFPGSVVSTTSTETLADAATVCPLASDPEAVNVLKTAPAAEALPVNRRVTELPTQDPEEIVI